MKENLLEILRALQTGIPPFLSKSVTYCCSPVTLARPVLAYGCRNLP